MALRTLNEHEWEIYFNSIGIHGPLAKEYSKTFHEEQILKSHIKYLSDEELRDFGVKLTGHKLIIRHAESQAETTARSSHQGQVRHHAPQLQPSMNPSSFRAFVEHWQVYKKLVGIPSGITDTAAQIYSLTCNDHPEIRNTITNHKSDHLSLSESEYLDMLRKLLTAHATSEVYRGKFFSMSQHPNESCKEWLKRLKEVAPDCDFAIM